jgi:carbamoyl-phosphate synthase/aspartate carbamoyltransferase/dihydroorotase
MLFLMFEI